MPDLGRHIPVSYFCCLQVHYLARWPLASNEATWEATFCLEKGWVRLNCDALAGVSMVHQLAEVGAGKKVQEIAGRCQKSSDII